MDDPRYPIGRFTFEGKVSPQSRERWIGEIAAAPGALRAAVTELTPAQQVEMVGEMDRLLAMVGGLLTMTSGYALFRVLTM